MRTCPGCGASREGGSRFCTVCSLDFWRAAADEASPVPEASPVDVAPQGGRGNPWLFVGAGAVLLLVGGLSAALLLGLRPLSAGDRPAPTPRILTAEERVIWAFFREARDPQASYTVVTNGTVAVTGTSYSEPSITVTGTTSSHGDDYGGHVTFVQEGVPIIDADVVVVDRKAYVREVGGEWVADDFLNAQAYPISPFARISTVTEIEYLRAEDTDGQPMHRLLVTKWLGGTDFSRFFVGLPHQATKASRMEIVVTDDGLPTHADLSMTYEVADGADSITASVVATYTFSAWGEIEPIQPPI